MQLILITSKPRCRKSVRSHSQCQPTSLQTTDAQVGIQAPRLSYRCICHLGNPMKTRFESGFCLLCSLHGPCCLSPFDQVWEIWLYWILSALCGGIWYTAGKKPATCRTCGKTFPRPNVTLKVRGKGRQESQLLSRHVSEVKRGLLE